MARAEILERKIIDVPERNQSDFRLEYEENVHDQILVDDIVSYLGEYRFNLPKFSYTLKYSDDKLKDPHRGYPMQALAQRSIDKKVSEGSGSFRERAEKQGIMSLDRQLMSAKEGDSIVWASPPGPKEEGYGNYGFIFIGNVKVDHRSEKTVRMTAIRLEDPRIEQFNKAINLLTGKKTDYKNAEEFLVNPKVLNEHLEEGYIDSILGMSFSFKPNEESQKKFELIIREMFPLISDFVQSAKDPRISKAEKIKEFYSLENYALKLKKDYERPLIRRENIVIDFKPISRLRDIVGEYGKPPPKVAGSCPANNNNISSLTSNILSKGSILNSIFEDDIDYEFDQAGPCKKCSAEVSCGPCGICRACDLAIRAKNKFSLN